MDGVEEKNVEIREIVKVYYVKSYLKEQTIQQCRHTVKRDKTHEARAIIEYKPTEKESEAGQRNDGWTEL